MNYEETLKELDSILGDMESKDITLNEMLEKYKKAIELYNDLEEYLKNYKQEIKIITEEGLKNFNENDHERDN